MDNAAMIARAGAMHVEAAHRNDATLDIAPRLGV